MPGRVPSSAITHHYVGRPSVIRSGSQGLLRAGTAGGAPAALSALVRHRLARPFAGNHTARHAARRDPPSRGGALDGRHQRRPNSGIQSLMPGDTVGKAHGKFSDGTRVWVSNDPVRASAYGSRLCRGFPHTRPRSPYANHDEHHHHRRRDPRDLAGRHRAGATPTTPARLAHRQHRGLPRTTSGPGPRIRGLFANVEMMFPDYYQHPEYYRTYQPYDHQSGVQDPQIPRAPTPVDIYRALPAVGGDYGVRQNMAFPLNRGDWVTTSYDYAKEHGESNLDQREPWTILTHQGPGPQLFTEGNSSHEWAYQGDDKLALEHPTARSGSAIAGPGGAHPPPRTRFTRDWQLIGDDHIPST